MSKDIIIQQAGIDQELDGVSLIRTQAADTGTIDWMPEDEATLGSLSTVENGTFTPSGNLYGFDVVTVNVPAAAVEGTINGVEYRVTVDENGYLVYTPI